MSSFAKWEFQRHPSIGCRRSLDTRALRLSATQMNNHYCSWKKKMNRLHITRLAHGFQWLGGAKWTDSLGADRKIDVA